MILVTGATGGIGGQISQLLKARGVEFRAMCRKQDQLEALQHQGIEAVLGDFDKPDSLMQAMKGCDQVFLITPENPQQYRQECTAIDIAKSAGVRKIVKLSASDGNVRSTVPWARTHALIDHHLRASGLEWTILKPTAFMQNFLWFKSPISKGFIPLVSGRGSVCWVDKRDVAKVAAKVLTESGHDHATYFLTGPETFDMNEAADKISEVIQHRVRYINLPTPVFQLFLRLTGNSAWKSKGLVAQFADVVAGHHDIDPTFEIERLTGERAKSFTDFIRDHRKDFEKPNARATSATAAV